MAMDRAKQGEQPLQVDILLAMLEANRPADVLKLAVNPSIIKILQTQADEDTNNQQESEFEFVIFSDLVTKFNRRGKAQERILLITQRAIYNLVSQGKLTSYQRRIPITQLAGVTLSQTGDEFVLNVIDEYGYHFKSHRRSDIMHCIAERFLKITGEELHAQVAEDVNSQIITRIQIERRQAAKKEPIAPTNVISNTLRALVSKKKIRWRKDGFDLDLTYITGRLIAMGFPSEDLEGFYRNPYAEVYRFFETRHKDVYKIYNLCSERKYEPSKFENRVACYPFNDHNPSSLQKIVDFCKDVEEFLAENAQNVVAVHCKAGKGRTGLMLASYMVWSGMFPTAKAALKFFGDERTHDGKGVTIPSQIRFVGYVEVLLRKYLGPERPFDFRGIPLVLTHAKLSHSPKINKEEGCSPFFKISNINGQVIFDSRTSIPARNYTKDQPIEFSCAVRVQGEVKLLFADSGAGQEQKICHLWFHTSFCENGQLTFTKREIDRAIKDKKHKTFSENFTISLTLRNSDLLPPPVHHHNAQASEDDRVSLKKPDTKAALEVVKRLQELETDVTSKDRELAKAEARILELERQLAKK